MGWARVTNAVGDATDPLRKHQIETLAGKISGAIEGSSQLDQIVVMRKHGRGGWKQTEFAICPEPDDPEPDPHAAADEVLQFIDSHADAEGPGDYQVRGVGLNSRGNSANLFSLHIPKGGEQHRSEQEIEGGDILRSAKEMVSSLVNANSVLLGNMERMSNQTERAYEAANKANAQLVEIEKIKMEVQERRWDREAQEREADREAKLSEKRMEHGVTILGWVADGYLATQANKGGVSVEKGAASNMALEKIFESLADDERDAARAAVGEEIMDLFLAAVEKKNPAERRGILREILRRFKEMDDGRRTQIGVALANAIGQNRAMGIMAAVRAGAA